MKCKFCRKTLNIYNKNFYFCSNCYYYRKINVKPWAAEGSTWEGDYLGKYLSGEKWRRKIFKNRVSLLRLLITRDSYILDIGAAAGLFINEAEKYFFNIDSVEPDNKFRIYSIKINPNIKHYISIDDLPIKSRYDFICIFDTIGYTLDLFHSIKRISSLLKQKGYLFVTSINADNFPEISDLSFNYYMCNKFWKKIFPCYSGLSIFRFWQESKKFNTRKAGSIDWWKDYLLIDVETKMNYIIFYKK